MARRLVAAPLDLTPAELVGHPERVLDQHQVNRVRQTLGRMVESEPLSRILGRREFWGLEFALSADTLDPRPETETVVEAVLRRVPDRQARPPPPRSRHRHRLHPAWHSFPNCRLRADLASTIAAGAAMTAVCNAEALGLAERAHFLVGDWGTAVSGRFDVIVANPPYIATAALADLPREVALYDPPRALDGGVDGLRCLPGARGGPRPAAGTSGALCLRDRAGAGIGRRGDLAGERTDDRRMRARSRRYRALCHRSARGASAADRKMLECAAVPSRVAALGGSPSSGNAVQTGPQPPERGHGTLPPDIGPTMSTAIRQVS